MLAAQAQPSEVTYTALLSMWGKSRHPKASQRIVEVFQHMRSAGRTLDTVGYRCTTPLYTILHHTLSYLILNRHTYIEIVLYSHDNDTYTPSPSDLLHD